MGYLVTRYILPSGPINFKRPGGVLVLDWGSGLVAGWLEISDRNSVWIFHSVPAALCDALTAEIIKGE